MKSFELARALTRQVRDSGEVGASRGAPVLVVGLDDQEASLASLEPVASSSRRQARSHDRTGIDRGGAGMVDDAAVRLGEVDLTRPSAARVYDYYLGGAHNFAVDREMAERAIGLWPDLPLIMQANRAFLRRAVRFCVDAGVRQFLDLGSGIPTVGNVHEVAQDAASDTRVVYVDSDPIAVAYSRSILGGDPRTAAVHADLREPEQVLGSPEVRSLLNFDEPIAVMMVAVLHFVSDSDDPAAIIAGYREAMAPGSFLVVSHASQDGQPHQADSHQDLYRRTPTPMTMRSKPQVTGLFEGFDVVEPGVVFLPLWRPASLDDVDERPERFSGLAAVGRKV